MFVTFNRLHGGHGGGIAKKRNGTVVKSSKEERRAVLAQKLQMRRALATKQAGN